MSSFIEIQVETEISEALISQVRDAEKGVMQTLAEKLPENVEQYIRANDSGTPSTIGNPPSIQSGELAGSFEAKLVDGTVELSMAAHGFYLEPVFEGDDAGGYLQRPFIEKPVNAALQSI